MGEVEVKLDKLKMRAETLGQCAGMLEGRRSEIESIAFQLSLPRDSAAQMKKRLLQISGSLNTCKNRTNALKDALYSVKSQYETAEREISGKAIVRAEYSFFNTGSYAGASQGSGKDGSYAGAAAGIFGSVLGASVKAAGAFGETSAGIEILTASATSKAGVKIGKEGISAEAKAEAEAALIKGEASVKGKYGEASVNAEILSAAVSAATSGAIEYKDGKLSVKADASVRAEVAAVSGEAEGMAGTKDFNVHGKAEGSLASAKAEAKAGISVDSNGFTAAAKAGGEAFLAKGEVTGGFTLFGVKVDLKGEAGIGVQAKAGGEVSTKGIGFNVGLGPIGGKLKIDWSDFNLNFPKK